MIDLDDETVELLRDLLRTKQECEARMQLICATYRRATKSEGGNYRLSSDCKQLIPQKDNEDESTALISEQISQ